MRSFLGARSNGPSDAEIADVLRHVAVYAGPSAALAVAKRVLEE